ncbi:MAG: alpha/beta fold hydrolase [Myxococcota bacterium]
MSKKKLLLLLVVPCVAMGALWTWISKNASLHDAPQTAQILTQKNQNSTVSAPQNPFEYRGKGSLSDVSKFVVDAHHLPGMTWFQTQNAPVAFALLVPGMGSDPKVMDELATKLQHDGIESCRLVLGGHHGGPRGMVSPKAWKSQIQSAYKLVEKRAKNKPIYYFGYSMGGTLGVLTLKESHMRIDKMVLLAPAIAFDATMWRGLQAAKKLHHATNDKIQLQLERWLGNLWYQTRDLGRCLKLVDTFDQQQTAHHPAHNPPPSAVTHQHPFAGHVLSEKNPQEIGKILFTAFAMMIDVANQLSSSSRSATKQLNVPTLVIAGEKDTLVSRAKMGQLKRQLNLSAWQFIDIANAAHSDTPKAAYDQIQQHLGLK